MKIVIHSFRKYTFITVGFLPLSFLVNHLIPTDMNMGIPFILNIAVTIIVCCVYYGIALYCLLKMKCSWKCLIK